MYYIDFTNKKKHALPFFHDYKAPCYKKSLQICFLGLDSMHTLFLTMQEKTMSKACTILQNLISYQMHNEKEKMDFKGMEPQNFLENALKEFSTDSQQSFMAQVALTEKFMQDSRGKISTFLNHNLPPWKEAFDALRMLYLLHMDNQKTLHARILELTAQGANPAVQHTYKVTYYIHQRICQLFYEVIVLVENGLAEGAYTLYRAMHELCCSLMFIHTSSKAEELALAYMTYAHEDTGTHMWAQGDARLANAPKDAIPFHHIEALCGMKNYWPQEQIPHAHLQSRGKEHMPSPDAVPPLQIGLGMYYAIVPALYAVRTLQIATEKLASVYVNVNFLLALRTLELWEQRVEALLLQARDNYFQQKEKEQNA